MKRMLSVALVAAAVAFAPTLAAAYSPGAGIAGTPHDFSGRSVGAGVDTGSCTFCHTPHKAQTTQLLWNHTLSTNSFSWDATKTTAGTEYPTFKGDTYKGATAKCLSCHDGSVAIGDVAWFGEGKPAAPLDPGKHAWPDAFNVGATDGILGSMKGNHPVAMPYPYLNAKNTYNGVTTGDGAVLTEWQPTPLANIRMFNDDGAGNVSAGVVVAKTGIECSSCHDPHNKAAVDDLFLRGLIGGADTNYICLKCHIK